MLDVRSSRTGAPAVRARDSFGAPDGSTPGIYWLPLADLGPRCTWLGTGLKSTAYHEAIPGHHFQLAIQQEKTDLPRYLKAGIFGFNSAYVEGWALYAERLADENGWYDGDLPGRLGFLNMQLFRARRLVVDTGLHAMKWTRQQVIDYGFTPKATSSQGWRDLPVRVQAERPTLIESAVAERWLGRGCPCCIGAW